MRKPTAGAARKALRRAVLGVALPVALVVSAGYGWYRWSDTGRGWRYTDRLATYREGLIPYKESAVFTSLDIDAGCAAIGTSDSTDSTDSTTKASTPVRSPICG